MTISKVQKVTIIMSLLLIPVLLLSNSYNFVGAQSTESSSINWYKICKNPIVDRLITEPCNTLTTNGGYTLTSEGQRVLACLGEGAVALVIPQLNTLKGASGCGSGSSSSSSSSYSSSVSNNQKDDPITNILDSLFG